jgi:L-threonylcarbamoyladenylate synthase
MTDVRTLHVDDDHALGAAATALLSGEVVLVPTDTVYGLAALPDRAEAVHRIYVAKSRPAHLPLPVLAASLEQVRRLGVAFPDAARILAARWWPGPLTMAFELPASSTRPQWLEGRDEVAVRIPAHDFLLALMLEVGVLMVTSANRHGEPTSPSAGEAGTQIAPHVDLVIDAGTLTAVPSTLVNVREPAAVVEREGSITKEAVAAALVRPA